MHEELNKLTEIKKNIKNYDGYDKNSIANKRYVNKHNMARLFCREKFVDLNSKKINKVCVCTSSMFDSDYKIPETINEIIQALLYFEQKSLEQYDNISEILILDTCFKEFKKLPLHKEHLNKNDLNNLLNCIKQERAEKYYLLCYPDELKKFTTSENKILGDRVEGFDRWEIIDTDIIAMETIWMPENYYILLNKGCLELLSPTNINKQGLIYSAFNNNPFNFEYYAHFQIKSLMNNGGVVIFLDKEWQYPVELDKYVANIEIVSYE